MVLKSERGNKPIYSPERYKNDMDNLKIRKETAIKRKEIEERDRIMQEEEEIAKRSIHKPNSKLDLHSFY